MRLWMIMVLVVTTIAAHGQDGVKKPPKGRLSGQWRTFYLGTYNKGDLKDFNALATGGRLKYVYPFGEHIKAGGALYTSFNLGIQDLAIPDATTGKLSRYELGLFDVEHPSDRLVVIPGELFLQFSSEKHDLTLGRMKIVSPFINPEDGRMIPTLEQGLWYTYSSENLDKLHFGVFNAIAPRSAGQFFNIGESIGKYPAGRNPDGTPSQYPDHTHADFVALLGAEINAGDHLVLKGWNYYTDNIFNTVYITPSFRLNDGGSQLTLEWLHQDRVGTGGNSMERQRYFSDESSNIIGAQWRMKWKQSVVTIGYDHILKGGRFLFPREWGRESLFSFQKRERSEGTANNHALLVSYDHTLKWSSHALQTILSVGHHWKPAVTDAEDNKYALPDYTQINLDLFYQSEETRRLKPELLLVYKASHGNFPENPNFLINKVDMFQVNFVVNYNF